MVAGSATSPELQPIGQLRRQLGGARGRRAERESARSCPSKENVDEEAEGSGFGVQESLVKASPSRVFS